MQGIIAMGDTNTALLQDPNFKSMYTAASQIKQGKVIETLENSGTALKSGMKGLSTGTTTLQTAITDLPKLVEGATVLGQSLDKVKEGTSKLREGVTELKTGVSKLSEHSRQIQNGIKQLVDGSDTLLEGSKTLYEGSNTFKNEVDNRISDTENELTKLDGLKEYTENPIEINEDNYTTVDKYGVVFAPYFMSLSLWVGALVLFVILYYDADNRFKLLGRNASNKILRAFLYLLLAIAQALVLAFLLKLWLGFSVTNIWLYYLSCILISMVFLAIIQFLIVNFKDVGKFLAILLLILQLTASGGTFPYETTPEFFQNIYPYMPMHYSVNLIKESLISIDNGFVGNSVGVLLGILLICVIFTLFFDFIKLIRRKRISKKENQKGLKNS